MFYLFPKGGMGPDVKAAIFEGWVLECLFCGAREE
jgi:hypothetical protein